jgi:hypothetical protein
MKRFCRLVLLVAAASLWAGVSAASASTQLPFTSTYTNKACSYGYAAYQGSAPVGTCNVTPTASTPTASARGGEVGVNVDLVSPLNGAVPWSANAWGVSGVTVAYHLPSPVPQLTFTVDVHVNSASATLDNSLGSATPNWAPSIVPDWTTKAIPPSITGHSISIALGAAATEAQCSPSCGGGDAASVVGQATRGTASVSGKDYVLQFTLKNPCTGWTQPNTPCGYLPAGDVIVKPAVVIGANQPNSWGSASASVDAVVTGVFVN